MLCCPFNMLRQPKHLQHCWRLMPSSENQRNAGSQPAALCFRFGSISHNFCQGIGRGQTRAFSRQCDQALDGVAHSPPQRPAQHYRQSLMCLALVCSRGVLIEKPLEACKHFADLFRPSKIGYGVRNRVVIFKTEQRCQFFRYPVRLHRHSRTASKTKSEKAGRSTSNLVLIIDLAFVARSSRVNGDIA